MAIRARGHGLTLHTMYFKNEINELPQYGHVEAEVKPQEIKLATELVGNLSAHFKPDQYRDEYQAKLQSLLDARLKGGKAPITAERKPAPVIDMMEALKKSLAKRQQAASRTAGRAAAAKSHATSSRRKAS